MQSTLYILGAISFILFFVGLGLSYRTWRVHTMLLVPAVFIAAVVFFSLAVQARNVHDMWGKAEKAQREKLAVAQEVNYVLEKGPRKEGESDIKLDPAITSTLPKLGVNQVHGRLEDLTRDRGRVWLKCTPAPVGPNGEVQVNVPAPKEHQIRSKMTVYVYEDRDSTEGGRFLGIFRVAGVSGGDAPAEAPMAEPKPEEAKAPDDKAKDAKPMDDKAAGDMGKDTGKPADMGGVALAPAPAPGAAPAPSAPGGDGGPSMVSLIPAWSPSPTELARLSESQGPWMIWEKPPVDDHQALVNLDRNPLTGELMSVDGKPVDPREELKKYLPASVVEEYVKDQQKASWQDPANPVADPAKREEDDPLERQIVLVKFLKDHVLPVEAAPPAPGDPAGALAPQDDNAIALQPGPGGGGFAGGQGPGQAPPPGPPQAAPAGQDGTKPQPAAKLYRGNTQVWLPVATAEELKKQQVVEIVAPQQRRYDRALRDYGRIFQYYYDNRDKLAKDMKDIEGNIAFHETMEKSEQANIETTNQKLADVTHDYDRFQFELKTLEGHQTALARQQQALLAEWARLIEANRKLNAQLEQLQGQAAKVIKSRAPGPQPGPADPNVRALK